LALGLTPDVVIGDMDSLGEQDQAQLRAAGTRFVVHPPAKDETDLELALLYALEQGVASITVLGALGGRLDQTLANILLLTMPDLAECDVRLADGAQTAFVVRDAAQLEGQVGDTVSLIPLCGDAQGVTTSGLLYPLADDVLPFGLGLGVSNEITATPVSVQLRQGLLLCVHLPREYSQEV
jgi:thiamine pyrophosphokinase